MNTREIATVTPTRVSDKEVPKELRILRAISKAPKSIDEISSETGIASEECRRVLDDLIDIGMVSEMRRSGADSREITRFREHCRAIPSFA